ncbi:PHOsphatase [Tyrophagus putrescentiae]|nr:PHOsphatase [Tyrophagus putrescentiae]
MDPDDVKEKFAMPTKDNTIMSHERCKKHRTPERKARERKEYTELSQSAPIQIMVRQWYQRNGLQFPPSQSGKKSANSTAFDTMTTVYQACANEMAVLQHSPWCALFTTNELKALSYMSDTYEYRSSTNADNGIACTIMKDLTAQLDAATARLKGGRGPVTPGSTLYFSHKGMISRLVQHLGLFSRAPSHHLDPSNPGRLCVAGDRQFRSSTVLPFGANFAAVLHQCGGDKSGQLKLLTLYNEMPVKIAGCSSSFCDLNEFMQFYGSATCPVDVICPLKK